MDFLIAYDVKLFELINSVWTNAAFDRFFPVITDLHKNFFAVIVILCLVTFSLMKAFRLWGLGYLMVLILTVGLCDLISNQVFKQQFQRSRPAATEGVEVIQRSPSSGYSFVSNHAANITCFATVAGYLLPGYARLLFLIALLVSYSRVYNGAHFPSDVVAGMIWGFAFGRLICWFLDRFTFERLEQIKVIRRFVPRGPRPRIPRRRPPMRSHPCVERSLCES